ncbi:hypothetical protein A3SI_02371 [Nitritalea halalkaliphila LW7]|uniref:CAAX prenyl protease 2/Lysostaphin resistance protein A-like domain-containing protein n=1 Tax=Nitritalea halalkaliphila LW7 TaxID=1189621 RepID=I5C9R8_9BACT|nr:hypothetical protein A3SI_02371 [Nitritalea halalkaliphila LW7]
MELDWLSLLFALLFAPIMEESVFRYALERNNSYKYITHIGVALLFVGGIDLYLGSFFLVLFIGFLMHFGRHKKESTTAFRFFVLSSALLFCLVHIPNVGDVSLGLASLILVICLFPAALVFSYVRVRYGFGYAILTHGLFNLSILTLNEVLY